MNNKVAIITGATSGIGKEYSRLLASKGYNLILVGRRIEIITKVARDIEDEFNVYVETKILDLTNKQSFNNFANEIESRNDIEMLINNAGYGAEASFTEDTFENQDDMVNVHIKATIKLCHIVSKQMKKNKSGKIINVCSLAAFNVFPTSAMYCATKMFLVSFSQSLAMELNKYNIRVQALCPGFTRTDFHAKLDMDESKLKSKGIVRWMYPQEVVEYSLSKIDKELKVIIIPGFLNRVTYHLVKFIPKNVYYKVASRSWDLL
ncbi:MAG: SDR family oxidoreductase [Clostridium sp.]